MGRFNNTNSSSFAHVGLDVNLNEKFTLFRSVNFSANQNLSRSIVVGSSLKFLGMANVNVEQNQLDRLAK
jgi:hypothetical protein